MEKMDNILEQINGVKEVTIDILKDTLQDYKKDGFRKTITIWLLVVLSVGSFIFYQYSSNIANMEYQKNIKQLAEENDKRFKEFLSQYDFDTTITQDLDIDNQSSVSDNFKVNGD